ncbi:protein MLN51 homolog isoform X2 [Rhodamnia argentea]|uniref:Protein MLN51 homolog isoform X2 n=1 Tax=Rhodamnia argentea TaxID=178133 RepID=A0ABM3GZB2_9MYRT|nr:protein MLN51 homolog isoform X2 [Rhodamnia argentea]
MATGREDEVEYESDPDETKQSLAMRRRRAASDDEESEKEEALEGEGGKESRAGRVRSEESDSEGGAADYDDEEGELEEEEELDGEEEEEEGNYEDAEEVIDEEKMNERRVGEVERNDNINMGHEEEKEVVDRDFKDEGQIAVEEPLGEWGEDQAEDQVEKKENEPYAVPTAGAFYMHDDRFRDNVGGRNRRTFGGRRLWESKDERKWGHDKFEEMTMQERRYDERRRTSRGNYRGRGRNRAVDRGYVRGNRARAFDNNSPVGTGNNSSNQNQVPRGVRGRGPRRYESSLKKSSHAPPNHNKQSKKPVEEASQDNLGSTSKDVAPTQKKDGQVGNLSRNNRASMVDDNFSGPPPNALLRGKNIANSVGIDKLSIDDSVTTSAAKPLATLHIAPTGSSVNASQSFQTRAQGKAMAPPAGQMPYQNNPSQGQRNRLSPQVQVHAGQRNAGPNRVQTSPQVAGQRPGSGSQASSPPTTAASVNSYETAEMEAASEANKSAGALVGKGKGSVQGGGRGSFVYSGAHVVGAGGNMGVGHGDQNFPGTPAFLPVMQFSGQHPGVPTVGMAFPGYVAPPQLGLGANSEMTWLPVLAGAAGALGATYCSPYIAVDGAYHAPSGQTTSMATSSKEGQSNKTNSDWKPSQKPELLSEEHGQRQNKPRRYSEMNFGQ